MNGLVLGWCAAALVAVGDPQIRSDQPYAVAFPAQQAKYVRLLIHETTGGQPCVDELEVYGPDGKKNLALATEGAKASSSSCLSGYPQHRTEHLNDGQYGNAYSWIPNGTEGQWAQIELPRATEVARVVLSRDRQRQYADRVPIRFDIQVSLDGNQWKTMRQIATRAVPVAVSRRSDGFAGIVPGPPAPPGQEESKDLAVDLVAAEKDEVGLVNLARSAQAKASASSLLPGHAKHQIAHLNDGLAGNEHSWISNGEPSWAEIDLGDVYWVCHVALGSDRSGQYRDRAPADFSILTATKYDAKSESPTWTTVYRQSGEPAVHDRKSFRFQPVQARWVRIALRGAGGSEGRIDEIEVFGQKDPIPADKIGRMTDAPLALDSELSERQLRDAFLAEEHAWLKTYGRADLSPRLVPYNGRVQEYPHHVGDDVLPLPPLSQSPKIDGKLDDSCWAAASRGVARVAWPYDFGTGPLIECAVQAGRFGDDLVLAVRTNRLLSSHVAVVSTTDGQGCGVLAATKTGVVFNQYEPDGQGMKLAAAKAVEGASDASLTTWEFRLPLAWFPDWKEKGIRVGLGMGGKHTAAIGRPVTFLPSPLALAEVTPCRNGEFQVRLSLAGDAKPVTLHGTQGPLADGVSLAAGESKTITVKADGGPVGPQCELAVDAGDLGAYQLHLFRYDPLERTLTLMEEVADRLAAKGLDVTAERAEVETFRKQQQGFLSAATPNPAAEREAFAAARAAKRKLFFRQSELEPIGNILFVKRHAFEPSHNYSVLLDSRWRPGGSVCRLEIPRTEGRFEPAKAKLVELFNAGEGIARNPMASFDLSKIYFGYRPSQKGFYHVFEMDPNGSGLKQLTDGPFHDYWPCPLPDGSLAFIGTRCTSRYLCWRPQVAVLFRMNADGSDIRPLSYANLSEWAPSVMSDGRIIWTRSEYLDKGADFSHTLWAIRPDGTAPELVFGNTIIQPNGYANGREVPGTHEICCTLISHFGDLNGPIALVDIDKGRFNPKAITSITPEVPWPGMWPKEECFRDPMPIAKDLFLCSHAPQGQFGLYVIDRFGNREVLYLDPAIGSMCPTPYRKVSTPPVLHDMLTETPIEQQPDMGQFVLADVYAGLAPTVPRGKVKYIRVVEEVRAHLDRLPSGEYRKDHEPFLHFYAAPVDLVSGPYGWPSYVAKAPWGLAPVEEDGSANFMAPAGKTLYFQALDENLNELQRMRSVVQLQPGEQRSCIGCHEDRRQAPPTHAALALRRAPSHLEPPPWGAGPFSYEKVVQPVWDAKCVQCHNAADAHKIDLTGTLDANRVPSSYKTLIQQGWVHYLDLGWNSGGNELRRPMTFGTVQSKLFTVLDKGHYGVELSREDLHRIKCWIDINCPLWPDYIQRDLRPASAKAGAVGAE